jgi:hypothetical protein
MSDKIRSYAELWDFFRISLRIQHPEWIEPNGESPICDSYQARFAELLGLTYLGEDDAANPQVGLRTQALDTQRLARNVFKKPLHQTGTNMPPQPIPQIDLTRVSGDPIVENQNSFGTTADRQKRAVKPVDPLEESLYWLISAAALVYLLSVIL